MSDRSTRRVVVTGRGVLAPLGDDASTIHQALLARHTAFSRPSHLDLDRLGAEVAGNGIPPAAAIDFNARELLPGKNVRPLDRTGQLTVIATERALGDAGWTAEHRADHEVGLVVGTQFGSVRTIAEFDRRGLEAGPKYVKPFDFANSVINAAAGQAAIWHDLRGPNATVTGSAPAGLQAIGHAAGLLRRGQADVLLAGGVEELCFESWYGYWRAGHLADDGVARPFDAERSGCVLGEGAAFVVLDATSGSTSAGLAEIRGHGNAFDPSRGRDRDRSADALSRAIRAALDDAGLDADAVDVVVAGAAGGGVDAAEARALHATVGDAVPVTAVRGGLGESLGAGGAFQVIALIEAMVDGTLPPITGLDTVDPTLPALDLIQEPRKLETSDNGTWIGLATAIGLDGGASALVVSHPQP
ncbi:MAG: beta-ketoacyl synthase N-terminal-like domain-containing protein [Acidobacteriota bacterium]